MVKSRFSIALVASLFVAANAQAAEPAGRVLWTHGQVERVAADGTATPLSKGDVVLQGDTIRSAAGSHAQLQMNDEALIAVRPDSTVRLTSWRYSGREDGSERGLIDLVKGGLRSVTGAIGRTNKENFLIRNDTHLVGIRGTDHETFATDDGTYNRVTLGGTYLQTKQGRIELQPGQVGYASLAPDALPSRLERTPEFMQVAALSHTSRRLDPAAQEERAGANAARSQRDAPVGNTRLERTGGAATVPSAAATLPAPSLGDKGQSGSSGVSGRCGGPCADPLQHGKPGKGGGSKGRH